MNLAQVAYVNSVLLMALKKEKVHLLVSFLCDLKECFYDRNVFPLAVFLNLLLTGGVYVLFTTGVHLCAWALA